MLPAEVDAAVIVTNRLGCVSNLAQFKDWCLIKGNRIETASPRKRWAVLSLSYHG